LGSRTTGKAIARSVARCDSALMSKLLWAVCATVVVAVLVAIGVSLVQSGRLAHDRTMRAELARLDVLPDQALPSGVVVPPHNVWSKYAFVAQRVAESSGRDRTALTLILNDHYRVGRSQNAVIGDDLDPVILCSVPEQAKEKKVELDPAVIRLMQEKCRAGR
jgi:hypothetical protein